MAMLNNDNNQNQENAPNWKSQTYAVGALIGASLGFMSAYLFTREAENDGNDEERPEVPPTVLLGIALSALSLIRQIAETARKKK